MADNLLDLAVPKVLDAYSFPFLPRRLAHGNAGGFSGSRIWQILMVAGDLCLKAWPNFQEAKRLNQIHGWMEAAFESGTKLTPVVYRKGEGEKSHFHAGRLWNLTQWMPGQADFHANPSLPRLKAACHALAQLHEAWSAESTTAIPPSVQHRLESARKWEEAVRRGWRPMVTPDDLDPVSPIARRIWSLLPPFLPEIEMRLQCWTEPRRLQPCLCDIWHDHVLFIGDNVSGIIDYGSMRIDTPATDLARMLGSLVGGDLSMWNAGFAAYREIRPLDDAEATLARVLDWTGVILGAANWLHRLYFQNWLYENRELVAKRMQTLVERMEYFASSALWGKAFGCL
ncbi:MAG TPA: phosphotransferase [Gemmataceae bacterium]|jgi:Ser/Thr protein kinase RdoA (MazF antagonist)|nr:phosphotransferase [Gemmataceae bacterium]